MRSKLKPPGIKRFELSRDKPLSNVAFKFKSRRYTKEEAARAYDVRAREVGPARCCPPRHRHSS